MSFYARRLRVVRISRRGGTPGGQDGAGNGDETFDSFMGSESYLNLCVHFREPFPSLALLLFIYERKKKDRSEKAQSFPNVPLKEVSVSIDDGVNLSFPLGPCPERDFWTIANETGHDVFTCDKNISKPSDPLKFKGECPQQGRTYTVKMASVEQADLGEFCLEIEEGTCSCTLMKTKNNSTDVSWTMWTFLVALIVWGFLTP